MLCMNIYIYIYIYINIYIYIYKHMHILFETNTTQSLSNIISVNMRFVWQKISEFLEIQLFDEAL